MDETYITTLDSYSIIDSEFCESYSVLGIKEQPTKATYSDGEFSAYYANTDENLLAAFTDAGGSKLVAIVVDKNGDEDNIEMPIFNLDVQSPKSFSVFRKSVNELMVNAESTSESKQAQGFVIHLNPA